MKKNNYLDIKEIENKLYFGKSYYNLPYNGALISKISVGKVYDEREELTKRAEEVDLLTVHYKGELKVSEGDLVKEDNTLSISGSIRKKYLVSPVTGQVKNINEVEKTISIEYKVVNSEEDNKFSPTLMPFKSKIHSKLGNNTLILEFEALTVNLFAIKGSDAIGDLIFIEAESFLSDETTLDNLDVKNKIVITDTIDTEAAARLSAMGVNGILVNNLSYHSYNMIMTLSMPIGIISGFDKDIEFDKNLKTFLKKHEGTKIIIDYLYSKVHILINSVPKWLD